MSKSLYSGDELVGPDHPGEHGEFCGMRLLLLRDLLLVAPLLELAFGPRLPALCELRDDRALFLLLLAQGGALRSLLFGLSVVPVDDRAGLKPQIWHNIGLQAPIGMR